jgi:proteasome assembly chaperone (PAC2) family protein
VTEVDSWTEKAAQGRRNHLKHYNAIRWVGAFMTMTVQWRNGYAALPTSATMLIAFPGIGNIGKVAIDSIRELHETVEVARIHAHGLQPLAELDEDGLLAPPHLSLCLSTTATGTPLLSLTGKGQPTDPNLQSLLAHELMEWFEQNNVGSVLVLAGMLDPPGRKETFAVASSASFRIDMESMGVDVRRDEPRGGAIGLGALLASTGPLYNINSACIIASTVGSSGDVFGSQRIIEHLERWFEFGLTIPQGGGEWLRDRLKAIAPDSQDDLIAEMSASHDAFYM